MESPSSALVWSAGSEFVAGLLAKESPYRDELGRFASAEASARLDALPAVGRASRGAVATGLRVASGAELDALDAAIGDSKRPEALARFQEKLLAAKPVAVKIDDLHETQADVKREKVRGFIEAGQRDEADWQTPVVVRHGGKLFVHDGHHRIAADTLRGRATATVRLVDLDKGISHPDLAKWRRFALAPDRVRRRRWADPFETDLPYAGEIRVALAKATTVDEVREAFSKGPGDQPRDEAGRWTSEGGWAPAPESIEPYDREKHGEYKTWAQGAAKKLGFPPEKLIIKSASETYTFKVGDRQFEAGGHYDPSTGEITIFGEMAPGVLVHEIQHAKYDQVMRAASAELDKGLADPRAHEFEGGRRSSMGVFRADGGVWPEFAADYPVRAAMDPAFALSHEELKRDDGVSDYSRAYWARESLYGSGAYGGWQRAVDETLAERARITHEAGSAARARAQISMRSPAWTTYSAAVDNAHAVIVRQRKKSK